MKNGFQNIVQQVKKQLRMQFPEWERKTYLLAVSGGPDSILLFHVFQALHVTFEVAHVNYKLRAQESDADQAFVQETCNTCNIPLHVHVVNTTTKKQARQSLQMLARDIRYTFFESVMHKQKLDYLVLGHHANDQIETVLLHLFRGTGINGLTGMDFLHKNRIRPLLTFTKTEITNALLEKKFTYRIDSSNSKNDYTRNYLRNQVLPAIEQKWPGIYKTMLQNIAVFKAEKNALYGNNTAFDAHVPKTFSITELENNALAYNHLLHNLNALGFTSQEVTKILHPKSHNETKKITSQTHTLEVKNNTVYLTPNKTKPLVPELVVEPTKITVSKIPTDFLNTVTVTIATDCIKGSVGVRAWQKGDKMHPLGMRGSKKISDMLTEYKLTATQKSNTFVLHDDEKILWLIGFRISEKAKLADPNRKDGIQLAVI